MNGRAAAIPSAHRCEPQQPRNANRACPGPSALIALRPLRATSESRVIAALGSLMPGVTVSDDPPRTRPRENGSARWPTGSGQPSIRPHAHRRRGSVTLAAMSRPPASPHAISVARGDAPADLLITGGRVFARPRGSGSTALAIADGVVAGWGEREALETVEVDGAALTPGFVDAHMHLESTKLWIDEFVAAVLPRGTTAVAADPHEIANVLGFPGILALARPPPLPFTFALCASSCVPASPFERSGADLDAGDVAVLIERHGALGVAEVMNFPGVIAGDPEMLARVAAAGRGARRRA